MDTKLLASLFKNKGFPVKKGELEGGGNWFGLKEEFITFDYIYDKTMLGAPGHKLREIVMKALLVGAFSVRVSNQNIIIILELYASM